MQARAITAAVVIMVLAGMAAIVAIALPEDRLERAQGDVPDIALCPLSPL